MKASKRTATHTDIIKFGCYKKNNTDYFADES
jgi:hypothetical protein